MKFMDSGFGRRERHNNCYKKNYKGKLMLDVDKLKRFFLIEQQLDVAYIKVWIM